MGTLDEINAIEQMFTNPQPIDVQLPKLPTVGVGGYYSINGIGQITVTANTKPDLVVDITGGSGTPIAGPSAHGGTELSLHNGFSGKGFFHGIASVGGGFTLPIDEVPVDYSYEHGLRDSTSTVTVGLGIHNIASTGGAFTYEPPDFGNGSNSNNGGGDFGGGYDGGSGYNDGYNYGSDGYGGGHDDGASSGGGGGWGGPTGSYGGDGPGGGYDNGASGGGGMGWGGPTGSHDDSSGSDGFPGNPANHGPGPQWPGGGQGSDPTPTPGNGAGGTGQIMDPILLDLSGQGIKITEESRSSVVMDATGSGLSHRTAWAGAGTAVLFYDPNGTGAITQKNQYVFTEWDPTAKDNMQALRDVFDSNGDGVLNASDAKFSQFKLMLTNADGTVTVETLAQAGIASINLKADTTNIQYSDGSAITGQTVFTYTNGETGTVATSNLAYDAKGYKVIQTTAVVGSVTTITTTGTNADGSVAYNDVQATAISGNVNTRTLTYDDNGDGVIDRSQVIVTTTNLDGSTTEAWANYLGNQAVKQSAVQTTTSADGNTVTILRDDRGGGWYDQRENILNVVANDNQRNVRWAA